MRLLWLGTCLVVASLFSAAQSGTPAQPQGRIIGSVVNDLNEPVGHARLCTSVVSANSAHTDCGAQETDADGHFDIRVRLETNRIYAEKPQAGHQADHNSMEQGIRVKLSELAPVANVTIKVGPAPAEVILDAVDRSTGNPVGAFVVRWIRVEDDGPVASTESNKNRVFVPPNTDLLLTVRSPGYERWFYTDFSAPSKPILRLASGERKTISVELVPVSK
jgi:hypothetical protein